MKCNYLISVNIFDKVREFLTGLAVIRLARPDLVLVALVRSYDHIDFG